MILAIDPGSEKVGLVLWSPKEGIIEQKILLKAEFSSYLADVKSKYNIEGVALGDGTLSSNFKELIESKDLNCTLVNEEFSTEEAKKIYFLENPPRGWRKLVPMGLLTPRIPLDGYAARVILNRFLKKYLNKKD